MFFLNLTKQYYKSRVFCSFISFALLFFHVFLFVSVFLLILFLFLAKQIFSNLNFSTNFSANKTIKWLLQICLV
ncbi:unnamed protein product [Meloidogyne enterolobii]|uniref:Uncharacterized protein n=1 Tax=Meloidogyne enterolobii TaxID=390850 RepID=A0ACB1B2Z1_MELEN